MGIHLNVFPPSCIDNMVKTQIGRGKLKYLAQLIKRAQLGYLQPSLPTIERVGADPNFLTRQCYAPTLA